jgi:GT2 family glycosyltransferase
LKSLTIGICSYQRRDLVVRLVESLDAQARENPARWQDVDVCVVLDGSADGSREALEAHQPVLPLRVIWQPNRGLSAARNQVIEAATGEVVLFLDDDLIPAPGAVERHRAAHEGDEEGFMLGPCLIPPDMEAPDGVRAWWVERYSQLEAAGAVERLEQFGVANASAPLAVVRRVGGFEERFTGYGWEDFEFGARVLGMGVRERYDAGCLAWHYTTTDDAMAFDRQRSIGRGVGLTFQLHPELAAAYFPVDYPSRLHRLLDKFRVHSPQALWAVAATAHAMMGPAQRVLRDRAPRIRRVAWITAYLAGVADQDATLLIRALGRPITANAKRLGGLVKTR